MSSSKKANQKKSLGGTRVGTEERAVVDVNANQGQSAEKDRATLQQNNIKRIARTLREEQEQKQKQEQEHDGRYKKQRWRRFRRLWTHKRGL